MNYNTFKKLTDRILALVLVLFLSPILMLVVILIKVDSKGPIIFKQRRVGKDKTLFDIYKFRTMRIDTPKDTATHLLENPEKWITKVGNFLRKSSLDELPQLFNILKGDMSFVGPRPALWNQYDLIELRDSYQVNSIQPGLTGWAQVNGRDELSIEDKVRYDKEYSENISLLMDIKCLLLTILKVIKSENVIEGRITK